MKAIITIALAASSLILSPVLSAQTVIWNEFVNGDLPVSLGTLSPGINRVTGAVGIGGGFGTGEFIDSDWVQFTVPSGFLLDQFVIRSVSGNTLAFGLDRGTIVGADTVEFGLFDAGSTPIDLLRFDSAPGPQPASTYIFSVSPALNDTSFRSYTLDLVLIPVPEPSAGMLLAMVGVIGVGWTCYRRHAA